MASDDHVPIIDISPDNPNAPYDLLSAATKHGFVFVKNDPQTTSLPQAEIDNMFSLSKTFFASPTEVKQRASIASNKAGKNHGWLSQGVEKLDPKKQKRPDVKEAFNLGSPSFASNSQPIYEQMIPTSLEPHTQTLATFQTHCHNLCQHLLTLFAQALEIPSDWFTSRHDFVGTGKEAGTVFRLLYYPARALTDEDGDDVRAGAHSDYGSLTLLFQERGGAPGLEILVKGGDEGEGVWSAVPVHPETLDQGSGTRAGAHPLPILVNIGDLLDDWTGGLLKSTVHRVVFPVKTGENRGNGEDRYSMAYFCHPLDDALLEAVPSRRVDEFARRKGRTREGGDNVRTARDHLMERLAATYSIKS